MKSLINSAFLMVISFSAMAQFSFSPGQVKVNEKRIEQRIFELAEFGKNEKG